MAVNSLIFFILVLIGYDPDNSGLVKKMIVKVGILTQKHKPVRLLKLMFITILAPVVAFMQYAGTEPGPRLTNPRFIMPSAPYPANLSLYD